jgi:hypothetical protein
MPDQLVVSASTNHPGLLFSIRSVMGSVLKKCQISWSFLLAPTNQGFYLVQGVPKKMRLIVIIFLSFFLTRTWKEKKCNQKMSGVKKYWG